MKHIFALILILGMLNPAFGDDIVVDNDPNAEVSPPAVTLPLRRAYGRNCNTRDVVVKAITEGYGEVKILTAVAESGKLIEIYESPETYTWSIVATAPNNSVSCIVENGNTGVQYKHHYQLGDPTKFVP